MCTCKRSALFHWTQAFGSHRRMTLTVVTHARRKRCRYYERMLRESPRGEISTMQVTLSSHSFKAMLQYLYTGFIRGVLFTLCSLRAPALTATVRTAP